MNLGLYLIYKYEQFLAVFLVLIAEYCDVEKYVFIDVNG